LVTLIVKPGTRQTPDGDIGVQEVVRLIRGRSGLTIDEVQQLLADGARRIVVNRRRSILPPPRDDNDGGDDGQDAGQDGGDGT
jgi:hypothetical protein